MSQRRKNRKNRTWMPKSVVLETVLVPPSSHSLPAYDFCSVCQGKCWNGSDNSATQAAAFKKFGIIPNKCVNLSTGPVCPYA